MSNKKLGTYVGLRVLQPTNNLLYQHCKDAGIPVRQAMFDDRLHTTVIYSRKHCPGVLVDPEHKYVAKFAGYEIFTGQKGEHVLVMLLDAPSVSERHNFIMQEHGATYDFPVYHPHITLSYNYSDNSVMGIPPFKHDIILGLEYTEDLDLNWGK